MKMAHSTLSVNEASKTSDVTEDQLPLSTTIIQDIFSSLTITEKCALAISIANATASGKPGTPGGEHAFYQSSRFQSHLLSSSSNNGSFAAHTIHSKEPSGGDFMSVPASLNSSSDPRNLLNQELLSVSAHSITNSQHSQPPIFSSDILSISQHSLASTANDFYGFNSPNSLIGSGNSGNKTANRFSYSRLMSSNLSTQTESLDEESSVEQDLNKLENDKQLRALEADINTVVSEKDRENLDVVMRMMGDLELTQIDTEVKLIQNNVRGWLLRKNYINLRASARTLQNAWRERKKSTENNNAATTNSINNNNTNTSTTTSVLSPPKVDPSSSHPPPSHHRSPSTSTQSPSQLQQQQSQLSSSNHINRSTHDPNLVQSNKFERQDSSDTVIMSTMSADDLFNFDDFSFFNESHKANHIASMNQAQANAANAHHSAGINNQQMNQQHSDNSNNNSNTNTHMNTVHNHSTSSAAAENDAPAESTTAIVSFQAAARGMIARKAFNNIRKQAMASVVIQKSLVQQWQQQESQQAHTSNEFS